MHTHTNPAATPTPTPTPTPVNGDTVFTLNRSQLIALKTFLERAEIKGYEVNRFLEIARIITDAEQRPGYVAPIVPLTPDTRAPKS